MGMMKISWVVISVAFMATFGVAPVLAQGTATPARPQAPATRPTSVAIPVTKIAVIYSEAFQDGKNGIARFIVLINKLNAEFQPTQKDLNAAAQRLKQLQAEVNSGTNLTPAQIQAKIDQLDQMKKDYQRKGEDAQASYQKRRTELLAPLQDDVGKALDAYAKAHGITMVIDGSQVPLVYAADSIDITKTFISDYNSKNPATASAATPK